MSKILGAGGVCDAALGAVVIRTSRLERAR